MVVIRRFTANWPGGDARRSTGRRRSRAGHLVAGNTAFGEVVLAAPGKALEVVFAVSPDAERERRRLDLRCLHKDMVVFAQLGAQVDRDHVGERYLVDHDGIAGAVGNENQGAGGALVEVLGDDDEVIVGPGDGGYANVVAEFAGTAAGRFLEEQGMEGTDEFGERSVAVGIADDEASVGRGQLADLGKEYKGRGVGCEGESEKCSDTEQRLADAHERILQRDFAARSSEGQRYHRGAEGLMAQSCAFRSAVLVFRRGVIGLGRMGVGLGIGGVGRGGHRGRCGSRGGRRRHCGFRIEQAVVAGA